MKSGDPRKKVTHPKEKIWNASRICVSSLRPKPGILRCNIGTTLEQRWNYIETLAHERLTNHVADPRNWTRDRSSCVNTYLKLRISLFAVTKS